MSLRGRASAVLLGLLLMIDVSGALAADPLTASQSEFASRLASAFASTEICDVDVDQERVAALLRERFGAQLSTDAAADLMYRVVVVRAIQGVQVRSQT